MGRLNFDYAPVLGVPTASATDVSKQAASTEFVQNVVPPGVVFPYAGPIPPEGWLLADGSAVSRTTYARLFAAIGTTYGVGDGTTTFNLPDLRGEFLRGLDNARGVDVWRPLGSAQADSVDTDGILMREASAVWAAQGGYAGASLMYLGASEAPGYGSNRAIFGGTETRPRNIAMNFIIKSQ